MLPGPCQRALTDAAGQTVDGGLPDFLTLLGVDRRLEAVVFPGSVVAGLVAALSWLPVGALLPALVTLGLIGA